MSNSQQDSGVIGVVAAVGLLVIMAVGFFVYQRNRAAQVSAQMAVLMAEREQAEASLHAAEAARKAAEVQRATAMQQASLPLSVEAEPKIRARLMAQQADWNKGDLDAFMNVYWKSDDLTFASGGKLTRGWQATLDGYKSRYSTKEEIGQLTFGDLEFHPLEAHIMLVLGTWHLERGDNSVGGNFSLIWKQFDGEWFIVHDHTSALPTKQP